MKGVRESLFSFFARVKLYLALFMVTIEATELSLSTLIIGSMPRLAL